MPLLFWLLLLFAGGLRAAEALPPVALSVSHESMEISADGIERSARFMEAFVREGDNLWLARAMPRAVQRANATQPAPGHEKEIEVMVVPRWITRADGGAATLFLVAADRKTLYEVPPSSYGALGFSGRWTIAAALVDPATVAAMPTAQRRGARPGLRWHEAKNETGYLRVLWDENLQCPRIIESGSLDGRQRARTTIAPLPMPLERPWRQAQSYTRRDYSDLGD